MNVAGSFRKSHLIWLLPTLLLAGLFVWLGLWQLDRAQQKRDILQQIERAAALPLTTLDSDSAMYSKVSGRGEYLPLPLLLDNQVQDGRLGVHVLSPVLLDDARLLLVNRGWLPLAKDRRSLPPVATPPQPVTIAGVLSPLPGVGMRLGTQPPLQADDWPQLVTYVDAQLLTDGYRKILQRPQLQLLPMVIKLDAGAAHGYGERDWQLINFGPNKHTAYALQWFSLALAVLITFVVVALRSGRAPATAR